MTETLTTEQLETIADNLRYVRLSMDGHARRTETSDEAEAYRQMEQWAADAVAALSSLAAELLALRKRVGELHGALKAALNMVDGDGTPPDWDMLRAALPTPKEPS